MERALLQQNFLPSALLRFVASAVLLFCSLGGGVADAAGKKEEKAEEPAPKQPAMSTEYVCEADVYYSWRRYIPKKKDDTAKQAPGGASDSNGSSSPELGRPNEVFFARPGERGVVEEQVRRRLDARLPSVRAEAGRWCSERHENQSRCIMERFREVEREYRKLDYASRAVLVESVKEDCSRNTGLCVETRASDISCGASYPPDFDPASLKKAEAEPEDKDGKKKGR
ncbi:MAG: hypothetical protein KDD44_09055 [Bdellovibrionales bacterium]|nr:hypothetical protein [Bdellovibrionales bacterium]